MEGDKKQIAYIVGAVVIALLALLIWQNPFKSDEAQSPTSTGATEKTTTTPEIKIEGEGDFDVEVIKESSIPRPSLTSEVDFSATLSADEKRLVAENIAKTREALKSNNSIALWLKLALYYKMAGDIPLAVEVWKYLTKQWPESYVAFYNLAETYAYDLKDNVKAESFYRKAITISPSVINLYRNFYTFYRYLLKDDTKAKAILSEGIAANPGTSQDLKYLLDNYDSL